MKKVFETLFIKDDGRIRVWKASIRLGRDDLRQEVVKVKFQFGLYGGTIQTKYRFLTEGKNIGKANETTPFQQAVSEVESEIRDMRNKGYRTFEDVGIKVQEVTDPNMLKQHNFKQGISYLDVNTGHVMDKKQAIIFLRQNLPDLKLDSKDRLKPMILHHLRLPTYEKGTTQYKKSKVPTFPVYVQPKKDGVCCLADPQNGLTTRQGKAGLVLGGQDWNDICPQIVQAVKALNWPKTLHGEVYLYGKTLGEITDACKKANKLSPHLQLHIFDVVDLEATQEQRLKELNEIYSATIRTGLDNVLDVVPCEVCYNWEDIYKYEARWLELGEEGIVVRNKNGMYLPGTRSSEVLKLVRFDSCEVEIIDVVSMDNEPSHGLFVCKTPHPVDLDHAEFYVTPSEFSHEQRRELLFDKHSYIGKMLTINHRGFTRYNVPRIATAKSIRYDT